MLPGDVWLLSVVLARCLGDRILGPARPLTLCTEGCTFISGFEIIRTDRKGLDSANVVLSTTALQADKIG